MKKLMFVSMWDVGNKIIPYFNIEDPSSDRNHSSIVPSEDEVSEDTVYNYEKFKQEYNKALELGKPIEWSKKEVNKSFISESINKLFGEE